jgi:hypothetical protein
LRLREKGIRRGKKESWLDEQQLGTVEENPSRGHGSVSVSGDVVVLEAEFKHSKS